MEILCYSETFSLSIVVQQSIIYWMLELKETKRKEYVFLAIFTYQREQKSIYKRKIFNFTCSTYIGHFEKSNHFSSGTD